MLVSETIQQALTSYGKVPCSLGPIQQDFEQPAKIKINIKPPKNSLR